MQEILSNILKDTLTTIYESFWASLVISILVTFFLMFADFDCECKGSGIKATLKYGLSKLKTSSSYRRLFFFIFYAAMLLHLTLLGRNIWSRPFEAVFGGWAVYTRWGLNAQPIENVMLFIPFTVLLFYALADRLLDRDGLPVVLLKSVQVAGAVSISIEVLQGVLHLGTLQISDIFYNVVGGMLGGAIYWCGHKVMFYQNKKSRVRSKM